jgi:hypothetical protein
MALAPTKPKRSARSHEKRRTGNHHKKNEHYLKTYWPYLPLALIVGLGFVVNSLWAKPHQGVLDYATDVSITNLLLETNNQRGGNGLGGLTINQQLDSAAQAKANDMAARNYWSHDTPDGQSPWTFFTAAGYEYQTAGENLAYGFDTSLNTVVAWMNSPGHRANILNNTYTEVGFGIANSPDYQGTGPETIVVAEYASPLHVAAAPSTPAASSPSSTLPSNASSPSSAAATPTTPSDSTPTTNNQPEANATPAPASASSAAKAATPKVKAQPITRIQLLANTQTASWSVFAISTIVTVSLAIFLLRHGLVWHRVLRKGEKFFLKHKMLDIALVAIIVIGVLLTRTVGVIK